MSAPQNGQRYEANPWYGKPSPALFARHLSPFFPSFPGESRDPLLGRSELPEAIARPCQREWGSCRGTIGPGFSGEAYKLGMEEVQAVWSLSPSPELLRLRERADPAREGWVVRLARDSSV
jgi:hypothetical protein